jgi:transcriptional regulator with XRE-family HTH domain
MSEVSPDPAPFAATLRAVRARMDLSQAEVAKRAGLTASYLSMLESRRKPPPSDAVVKRLARALDLEPSFLLEIAHLERTPEDIRRRMAGLRRSLETEKEVSRKVLRGPFLEMLWHFLSRRGMADPSIETLRLSRKTRRIVRGLVRDAGRTPNPEAFRERASDRVESLDVEARDELLEAMPDLAAPLAGTAAPESSAEPGAPVLDDFPETLEGLEADVCRLPVPPALARPDLYWFRVKDQDMYPQVHEGDLLLLAPGDAPASGDLVAMRLDGRETIRTYLALADGAQLAAVNSAIPPTPLPGGDDDPPIAAVARWLTRPLGGMP